MCVIYLGDKQSKGTYWVSLFPSRNTAVYFDSFRVFISAISGRVSISAFASLIGVLVGFASSAVGLNICVITAEIKKYESIIKKNRKKRDKTVLLGKAKSNIIKVLISKTLINSYISHDKFVWVNNVLREYSEMKKEIKNPENAVEYTI